MGEDDTKPLFNNFPTHSLPHTRTRTGKKRTKSSETYHSSRAQEHSGEDTENPGKRKGKPSQCAVQRLGLRVIFQAFMADKPQAPLPQSSPPSLTLSLSLSLGCLLPSGWATA